MELTNEQLDKLVYQIETLTDNNHHTEAIKVVCDTLGYTELSNKLAEINKKHITAGCMTDELLKDRKETKQQMLKFLYADYNTETIEKIKMAY